MQLPGPQLAVLEAASATEKRTIAQLAAETDQEPTTLTGAAFELAEEGFIEIEEREEQSLDLTAEGRTYREEGLPELRLYRAARETGAADAPVGMGEVIGASGLEGGVVDIALSNFARKEYGKIEAGELSANPEADPNGDNEAAVLEAVGTGDASDVDPSVLDRLVDRGLAERSRRTERIVTLTEDGVTALMEGIEAADTVGRLTPELLTSGEWREADFREYDVEADADQVHGGRTHVLRETAERVKDVLVGMGFEEMDGPHVDADFWINDALFMPQDHPARTHWDRFALSEPAEIGELPEELVERVETAHREGVGEDGEGYHSPWSPEFARQLALRGHTTSLSMRYLSGEAIGDLEPPQRYFSVEKAYRNDAIDATHLLEFFQIEGWVMAEDLSVRDLMGTFTEFYEHFGITDIEFKPHYNPYTEPSFELFGTHPVTGELIEIGNSGLFRDEVLRPLGVDCDVMAWGLALERLAMLTTGAEDIRDLHGTLADLDFLRNAEVSY
ncbi:phenylalanine--tRNA ligase subunit alpha [Halobacteriales archaeon QS_3_64_16]|nr:MAG: phenylalanine--tRNA ligase subunit alpha [Halobacteriales archaeon QS_3_64_16]